jgi:hypothetical protein
MILVKSIQVFSQVQLALGVPRGVSVQIEVEAVDLAVISFKEQVKLVSTADILMGLHGAGLTHFIFTQPHAHVFELIPFSWEADEYETLAAKARRC